ncbi:septum formation initiator family protein [Capnocytophaga sp. ARDL2]|uniref:FtsB family cell division protein n=1 Tax=Capnocytophaga sp. ARDL2 TaxID=3238809 RepID=UPI0035585188
MYNSIQSFFKKKKYGKRALVLIISTLFFLAWVLFLDTYSYSDRLKITKAIDRLNEDKKYYLEQIELDKAEIKRLENIEELEKHARQKYFMKRTNEDIYIIEIDEQYK